MSQCQHGGESIIHWTIWLQRFNNLMAIGVHDIAQKRALLLHYAGIKVFEVFDTLLKAETGDVKDYDKATWNTSPRRRILNSKCTSFNKRARSRVRRSTGITHVWDKYQPRANFTRMTGKSSHKIQSCTSQHLKRHALRETTTLHQTLDFSRSLGTL